MKQNGYMLCMLYKPVYSCSLTSTYWHHHSTRACVAHEYAVARTRYVLVIDEYLY